MNTIATDLDGTIYLNNEIIPGVIESLLDLDKYNLKIIFITNNSSQAPMEICNKLEKLLLIDIDLDQIVTPLVILKQYLENKNMMIYVHGSDNLSNFVNSIANVTTNIGDNGKSILGDGSLVSKSSHRVCAFGSIDNLNSFIYFSAASSKCFLKDLEVEER